MSKKKRDPDCDYVQDILSAIIAGYGRGGLTWAAAKLGISVPNLHKRLRSAAGAFDAVTLRAVLLILASKSEKFTDEPAKVVGAGSYAIALHEINGDIVPSWRIK